MKRNYDLRFYDLVARCFTHLNEKYHGEEFLPWVKEAIICLWNKKALKVAKVPVEQDLVKTRMLDRLDADKLDEFVKEQLNSGWDSSADGNAESLYWCLMTIDEYGEIFEDDLFYDVILED